MMDLFFVGDGARDHVTVPILVERLLRVPFWCTQPEPHHWARLHDLGGGKGYGRQLRFALLQAKDAGACGIVATVDTDKHPKRQKLNELRKAREADRACSPPFPTALAEAMPHAEAWLLDDRVAVVNALGLGPDASVPTVRQTKSPKDTLEELKNRCDRAADPILEILADIAKLVDPARCVHAAETGFEVLVDEVQRELGPIAAKARGEG
jgi:hypothetical protein